MTQKANPSNGNILPGNPKKGKESFRKPLQLILLIFLGVICILIAVILRRQHHEDYLLWADLLNALGDALIIGPSLTWILDLPSMVGYFKKITIESLISRDYLNSLDRVQLVELRRDCTSKIHLKDAEQVEKGLIDMDENVCELLTKPYAERYRQSTICKLENDYFIKKHIIEEYIVNPLNTKVKYDDFPKNYLNLAENEKVEDVFKVSKLTVKINDEAEIDYTSKIKIAHEKINRPDKQFNTEIKLLDAMGNGLSIDFTKSLHITRTMEVRTAKSDITFLKRVTIPVKSFRIDYKYSGDDLRLVGSCFGTLSYPSKGGIKVIQEGNYISIESFDWLLPGNGIYIVKIPQKS